MTRKDVAERLGLREDSPHLEEALTHPSYANERGDKKHYQRLEYLGDAVLQLFASEALWRAYPGNHFENSPTEIFSNRWV